jgi:PleD family two-component response regulator
VEQRALPHPSSPVGKVVTASLGVCSLVPLRGDTASTLVHETDLALYRAKASGRNRVARSGSS